MWNKQWNMSEMWKKAATTSHLVYLYRQLGEAVLSRDYRHTTAISLDTM